MKTNMKSLNLTTGLFSFLFLLVFLGQFAAAMGPRRPRVKEANLLRFIPMETTGKISAHINGVLVGEASLNGTEAKELSITGKVGDRVVWTNSMNSQQITTVLEGKGEYDNYKGGLGHHIIFKIDNSTQVYAEFNWMIRDTNKDGVGDEMFPSSGIQNTEAGEDRSVMEFRSSKVKDLNPGSVLTLVIGMKEHVLSSPIVLELYGYEGDCKPSLADFSAGKLIRSLYLFPEDRIQLGIWIDNFASYRSECFGIAMRAKRTFDGYALFWDAVYGTNEFPRIDTNP